MSKHVLGHLYDGKPPSTNPCVNYARAKAWHAKKREECKGREETDKCKEDLRNANSSEIQREEETIGHSCGGGQRRRKTRGRRRKTRGSRRKTRGGLNPIGSPDTQEARHRVVVEAIAQRQAEPASTAAVGGPSPVAPTPPTPTPPTPSFSSFLGKPHSLGFRQLVNNFLPKASPSQENPQDVARRNWCHAKFESNPTLEFMCFQQAPDDVSDTNPWPPRPRRAGRRRITRRR